jgi:hypothetical protein
MTHHGVDSWVPGPGLIRVWGELPSMPTALTGAVAGVVGALAMVPVMKLLGGGADPPFAVFWATFVGDGDPEAAMPAALGLHLAYGAVAGAVFVPLLSVTGPAISLDPAGLAGGIVGGILWSLVLLFVAMAQANVLLDLDPDNRSVLTMGVSHLTYGVVLGLLVAGLPI